MFTKSARYYDELYAWKDYVTEAAGLVALIRERSPQAKTLLDVGCGTGKHLEQLAASYRVEGVDLDPELLAIAGERLPGVQLHQADMLSLSLGRRFDVVTCLFSSIGYMRSLERVRAAIVAMRDHLVTGGLLVLEPWLSPDAYAAGRPHALFVDTPALKLARMDVSGREGDLSILDMHYLRADASGVEHFSERHELILLSQEQYVEAFKTAGFTVEHDPIGPMGRGLYLGRAR